MTSSVKSSDFQYAPLCVLHASKVATSRDLGNIEDSELYAEALIAAWRAVESFDASRGMDELGYVSLCVQRAVNEQSQKERSRPWPVELTDELDVAEKADETEVSSAVKDIDDLLKDATPASQRAAQIMLDLWRHDITGTYREASEASGKSKQALIQAIQRISYVPRNSRT